MSEPVSYAYFKPLCDKMDGRLPTPMNTTELAMLHDEVSSAYKMLLPETKYCQLDEAGTQVSFYSGQILNDNHEWENPYTGEVI